MPAARHQRANLLPLESEVRRDEQQRGETAEAGTFGVGKTPVGVAFDGANIWVTNRDSNTVTKLQASDGKVLGTFGVGFGPIGVAFDGANIWVTIAGANSVSKL